MPSLRTRPLPVPSDSPTNGPPGIGASHPTTGFIISTSRVCLSAPHSVAWGALGLTRRGSRDGMSIRRHPVTIHAGGGRSLLEDPTVPEGGPTREAPAVKAFSVTGFAQLPSEGLCPRRARAPRHHRPTAGPLAALLTFSQFRGGPCPHAPPWVTLASSSGPECTRRGLAGNRHTEGR